MDAKEPVVRRIEVKSIASKTAIPVCDYAVNPYAGCTHACKYCYASFMKRFTGHKEDWGTFLDVKYWPPEMDFGKYSGKEFFFGTVTDPYLPEEKLFGRTRRLLEQIRSSGIKVSIQTKSDLVLRDIDLLKELGNVRVGFSVNTLDESFKGDMDCAVSIARRLAAMKRLYDEGIRTTCFISPIFPGITDAEAIIGAVKNQCNLIWLENLNLRGEYKSRILDYVKRKRPDLLSLYREIYIRGKRDYWEKLDAEISRYADRNGFPYLRNDDSMERPFGATPAIVNYFYHEEVKKKQAKGANRKGGASAKE